MQKIIFQKHNEAGTGLVRQSKPILDISNFCPRLNVLRVGHWRENIQPHHDLQHVPRGYRSQLHSGMDPLSHSAALPPYHNLPPL